MMPLVDRPACERCGGRTMTSRSARCPNCTGTCRSCDQPILERGKKARFCLSCALTCRRCGGATRQSGDVIYNYCSPCTYARKREVEIKAKEILGNRCSRCGITNPLQWDHIENDPRRRQCDMKRAKRSGTFQTDYAEIAKIARGEESKRLQLHCPNCNWLKENDMEAYMAPPLYGPYDPEAS